eukprot:1878258-Rhodomonas_salina.2
MGFAEAGSGGGCGLRRCIFGGSPRARLATPQTPLAAACIRRRYRAAQRHTHIRARTRTGFCEIKPQASWGKAGNGGHTCGAVVVDHVEETARRHPPGSTIAPRQYHGQCEPTP